MIGFIYIMSNPSYPGDLKIGQTGKDPENRRKELGSATGVLGEFVLEYRALSEDYVSLEREIHRQLVRQRVNPRKEFFTISVREAVEVIRKIAGDRIESDKVYFDLTEEPKIIEDRIQKKIEEDAKTIRQKNKEKVMEAFSNINEVGNEFEEDLSKRKTERTTKLRKAKVKQSAKNIASTQNQNKLHQRVIGGVKSSIAYYSKVMLVGIVISFGVLFIFSVFK